MQKLANRVAIITGAGGSGLGAATAKLLAANGAKIAIIDVSSSNAQLTVDAIASEGGTARAYAADVSDVGAASNIARQIMSEWGTIDVLVANCGIFRAGTAVTTSEEDWDLLFRVNVRGAFAWARAVLPYMIERKAGSIVLLTSQLAFNYDAKCVAYAASKGALVSMAKGMAVDHGPDGIRVNCLCPAVIDTPASRETLRARFPDDFENAQARRRQHHALNRLGEPDEVARAALFLASDDSSFTTGTTLFVDGGWTAK